MNDGNEPTIYIVNGQEFELQHYGVKGMKWGKRKNVYDINAAYYNKHAKKLDARANRNRVMASMNKAAADSGSGLISKVNRINANYYQKRADKLTARADKNRTMATLNAQASKRKGEAAISRSMKKVGNQKVANAARTNQYLSGMRAAQALLDGNVVGAAAMARKSSMYRDAKEYWK